MDLFRNSAVDILSFILVDGVFKQFAKSIDGIAGKRKLWLKEFYVLSTISALYLITDHVPYILSVVTAILFVVTQNPLTVSQSICASCDNPNSHTCKVPGNVSFRSPLPKNPASQTPLRQNGIKKESDASSSTPVGNLFGAQGSKVITPFTSFKGNLMKSQATSTPCPPKSDFSDDDDNDEGFSKNVVSQYASVLKHKMYLLCVVFVDCFVHDFLVEFLALFLKPFKPVIQTKISPETRTSLSAARSIHVALSSCGHLTALLRKYLENEAPTHRDGFMEILRFISENHDPEQTNIFNDAEFLGSKAFYDMKIAFPLHFNFDDENSSIVLQKPIDRLMKSFIEKADISTRVFNKDSVPMTVLKQMLNACTQEIESCAGVFGGNFHSALSKLSMAQWILNQSKTGTSVISGSFEGQIAETMFCSTCDSFSYHIRKFRVLDLEILVAPTNQAKKITTLTDCLQYLTTKKAVKRVKNFECVCHDEFMQVHLGKVDKNANNISAENVKQVSFADEASLNISTANVVKDPAEDTEDLKRSQLFPDFKQFSKVQFCQLPEYLIINLGRFAPDGSDGNIVKTINQLIIPEYDLDLYPYSVNSQSDVELGNGIIASERERFKYCLTCLIAHEGYTYNDGQYITYIKLGSSNHSKQSLNSQGFKTGRQPWLKVFGDKKIKVNMRSELCSKMVRENAIIVIYKRVSIV